MKTYCALGLGNNFFYPLGTDSVPIPQHLLVEAGDTSDETSEDDSSSSSDAKEEEERVGTKVSLLPINPKAKGESSASTSSNNTDSSETANEWLASYLPPKPQSTAGDTNKSSITTSSSSTIKHTKYSSNIQPLVSCGATHTSFILPKPNSTTTPRSNVASAGEAHLVGTIFGHTFTKLTVQPTRLPLRIIRVSSGRRHVLALTEGASPGGGVVMSWGAGHFGQLGHGPELTSCLEPRIVERLLPHVVGGNVIEIAAGGLHSAAIVASAGSSSRSSGKNNTHSDKDVNIVVRETKTFAWGSNRKGQCGIEGGKCATVPEPLPVIMVKREEKSSTKRDNTSDAGKSTDPVDRNVHFEKLSLGRLHSVALTAYGEVFTWGSTSMGRCGHSSVDSSSRGSDRRFVQQPRHVSALRNVSVEAIAAGAAHTLALSKGGRVFAWGAGGDGQCGQGHAGNLFSPRAVQGLPSASNNNVLDKLAKKKSSKEGNAMPHVNSKVAMEVSLEEEALSKALSMSQITQPSNPDPKSEKIVTIRAAGNYSAAITASGDVYTWGYGSGAAIGHPIASDNDETLPMIPIIEGNQYSTSTAAKVFPAGGSEDNKIRDCRCFDTDLNIMLPRRVAFTRTLGLRAEDVSVGPGHMVILCSIPDNTVGNGAANAAQAGQTLYNSADDSQNSETDNSSGYSNNTGEGKQSQASGSAQQGLTDASTTGTTSQKMESATAMAPLGDTVGSANTLESNDNSTKSNSEKRQRRSPGWMKKIKSSRTSKHSGGAGGGSATTAAAGPETSEKRKSFLKGKLLKM